MIAFTDINSIPYGQIAKQANKFFLKKNRKKRKEKKRRKWKEYYINKELTPL